MFLSLRQLPLALAFCFSASAFAVDLDLPSLPLEEALLRLGVATGCKIEPPAAVR